MLIFCSWQYRRVMKWLFQFFLQCIVLFIYKTKTEVKKSFDQIVCFKGIRIHSIHKEEDMLVQKVHQWVKEIKCFTKSRTKHIKLIYSKTFGDNFIDVLMILKWKVSKVDYLICNESYLRYFQSNHVGTSLVFQLVHTNLVIFIFMWN